MTNNCTKQWEDCLRIIRDNISPEQYNAWFKPIVCVLADDGQIILRVPSPFFVEQLEGNYYRLLGSTLARVFGPGHKLGYQYEQVGNDPTTSVTLADSKPSPDAKPLPGATSNPFVQTPNTTIDPQLNPHYTFENYCQSECNQVARSIGEAIANDPRCKTFNPLFVFGAPGVGKTHLIEAIGIRIKEREPRSRVLYVTARDFEAQYTTAVRQGRTNDFIAFYQSIDVLIIDDIQDLIGKKSTQGTFFHIFNHLHQHQKQLILSSDCSPSLMEGMEQRLISRFRWGATAQLGSPDYNLRIQALRQRAAQDGLTIPDDVIEYIAANITSSVRELEGIVVSLLAHSMCLGREITLDLAKRVINNAVKISKKTINFEMVLKEVSDYFNVTPESIFSNSRTRQVSDARQLVMYLSKKHANMSLVAIGHRLSRTHATVKHGCNNIDERIAVDKQLRDDISKIEQLILA